MSTNNNVHHFYELDILRFFSAFFVLLFHLAFRGWNLEKKGYMPYPELSHFVKYGYLGVDAFFLISGFVILLTASKRNATHFLISRFSRLYPAYWICVTITFLFTIYFPAISSDSKSLLDYFFNMTMFQGYLGYHHMDGSYWTLMIEMQFYALIYFVLLLKLIQHIGLLLGIWLISLLCLDIFEGPKWLQLILNYEWGHYFIAGASFYLVWKNGIKFYLLTLISACYIRAIRFSYWYMLLKQNLTGIDYNKWIIVSFVSFFFIIFFFIALNKWSFWFSKRISSLGNLTYPLYLIHGTIGIALLNKYYREEHRYLLLISVIILMIILAFTIYSFVEKNGIPYLKNKLTYLLAKKQSKKLHKIR